MSLRVPAVGSSGGNEEIVIRKRRKGNPFYIVAVSPLQLLPAGRWKADFINDDTGNVAELVSKKSVRHVARFTLIVQ